MQKNIRLYRQQLKVLNANPTSPQWGLTVDRWRSFKIAPYEQANAISLECATGLDNAVAMPPKDDELDGVSRNYATTLRALIPLLNEAETYYSQKDFADDKMAKGRKMDATIAPLFDALLKHSDIMRSAVGARNDKLREAQLTAIEKAKGRNIEWHTLNVMITARRSFNDVQC
jgi:Protein of unknown function (DUF3829)